MLSDCEVQGWHIPFPPKGNRRPSLFGVTLLAKPTTVPLVVTGLKLILPPYFP